MENRTLIMMMISLIYLCFLLATIRLMLKDIGLKLSGIEALKRLFYREDKELKEF